MRLSRFLFSKNQFSTLKKRVKYNAFVPHKKEVSVYKTDNIDEREIWRIGKQFVATVRGKEIKARADIQEDIIIEQRLSVVSAPTPHFLHANIIDWPTEKSAIKLIAMVLAKNSKLVLPQ